MIIDCGGFGKFGDWN